MTASVTVADRKAARDGFCWVVIDPSGRRIAYCDTIHDAAAEANRCRGCAYRIDRTLTRIGGL